MISDSKNQGSSEFGKIVIQDVYKIRKFPCDYFSTIVDIGANIGFFCSLMRYLHPHALIVAVEPCKEVFHYLQKNVNMLNINIENKAFGNGETFYFINRENRLLSNIFDATDNTGYGIESIDLKWLFETYKIDVQKPFLLKFDCEGGEKYLLNDEYAHNIIRQSTQTCLEVHFKSPSTPFDNWLSWEQYNQWLKMFSDTHKIEYYISSKKRGYGHYCLVKE